MGGGFAAESGSVDIHVELESGTISGSGSGDLLLEDIDNGRGGKFDSATVDNLRIRTALENETGGILSEASSGSNSIYIVNQDIR